MESLQRKTKREQITEFFVQNLGSRFRTDVLHRMFGPSFRTRVSEINRSESCPLRIVHVAGTELLNGLPTQVNDYYAEWK